MTASPSTGPVGRLIGRAVCAAVAGAFALHAASAAAQPCGLCAREIVTNSLFASCFLARYETYDRISGVIVIDLSGCGDEEETDRGVIEALPQPGLVSAEPDTRFIVSRTQLDCLKEKLEEPDLVLDPSTVIDLGSCG